MCKMTETEISDVVLEQSSSSTAINGIVMVKAAAIKRSRALWRWTNSDHEVSDGFSTRWKNLRTNIVRTKEQNLGPTAGTTAVLWYRFSPPASWLPDVFLFCPWCCSEFEDSAINLWIQHSNCLCPLFDLCISCTLSPSQVSLRYTLSFNSLYLHTLPTSKLHQQKQILFCGVMGRHSCL